MAGENIRISKILKDFNIGLNTLAEFLNKKNVNIEVNPRTLVGEDVFELIKKEFGNEQVIKEQSKKVATKLKEVIEKESPRPEPEYESDREVIIKTSISTPKPAAKPAPQPAPAPAKETAKEPAAASVAEPKQEIKAEDTVKAVGPSPAPAPKPAPEAKPAPAPKPVEKPVETPASKVPENKPGVRVVGRLELDKKGKPVPPKPAAPAPKSEPAPTAPVIEHIETSVQKLAGPQITGKIDLSQFDRKPSANPAHKKRERIKGGPKDQKVDVSKVHGTNKPQSNNGGSGKKKSERFAKPVRVEVDEDQVQKQIRETYLKMTEGHGKTKGSKHRREKREMISQKEEELRELQALESNILKVTEFVTVNELAIMMNTPVTKVIEACMNLGLMVSINQRLDAEALVLVAEEFNYKIECVTAEDKEKVEEEEDRPEDLVPRPPIITVMGHVDHGKTSLLDYIRKSNVIAGEAGGITQHIGAYHVELPDGRKITFLDTPGHEAFTAMRARGAKITDLAIIIVAADDAIMPQTVEAINHAQAAGVPMIFAINKIDKTGANPEKIREQLSNMNILVEDWGGKYQCQEISAKKGINVDLLLEKVLLEADMLELKANPNRLAKGSVIESSRDKGRGYLATVMVQNGTLHVGDIVLSGSYYGRVKAMYNERGQKVDGVGPATPVSVLGLNGAPTAGELFNVMEDEREAKELANKREQLLRVQGIRTQKHTTLEEIGRRIAIGNFHELNIIVKGDVDGSVEALSDSLIKLSTEEIEVNVIHKAVGAISESDVLLASASNAIIIGFQVRPDAGARKLAEKEEIEIRQYSVIYDAIEEVKSGLEGMLAPEQKEEITATAEVRETFKISKVGTIAGCVVREGKLYRSSKVRVIRDGIVIYTGELGSLKRFKDDVKEVTSGMDCGLNIDKFNDIKVGDVVEAYQIIEIKRKL